MDFLPPGIIASGPHNGGGLDMTILNGLAPEPPRSIVASFRGLGSSVPPEGEGGSAFGILWIFAIFGAVAYFGSKGDKRRRK